MHAHAACEMRNDSFTSNLHRGAAKGEGRQIALHSASAPRELERKAPDYRGPRRSWRSLEVRTSFGAASLRLDSVTCSNRFDAAAVFVAAVLDVPFTPNPLSITRLTS